MLRFLLMIHVCFSLLSPDRLPKVRSLSLSEAAAAHSALLREGFISIGNLMSADDAHLCGARVLAAVHARARKCAAESGQVTNVVCEAQPPKGAGGGNTNASFLRARDLGAEDPWLGALTRSHSLARVVAKAMNVSGLRLYEASAFVKLPKNTHSVTRWHSDAAAMPLRGDRIATLWIALSDIDETGGALIFLNGSHLPGVPLPSLRDVRPPRARLAAAAKWVDADDDTVRRATRLAPTAPRRMLAGEATIHLGWTLHSARPNLSPRERIALAITYFADGMRVDDVLEHADKDDKELQRPGGSVRFTASGAPDLLVHLLSDDLQTWTKWLHHRPPLLVPGSPIRDELLTPLVYNAAAPQRKGKDL